MAELSEMTKAELVEEAKALGFTGLSACTKAEILTAVKKEQTRISRAAAREAAKEEKAKAEKAEARAAARAEAKAAKEATAAEEEKKAAAQVKAKAKQVAKAQPADPAAEAASANGINEEPLVPAPGPTRYEDEKPPTRYSR